VLITGLAAVILIFVVLTVYSVVFGVEVWMLIVSALRIMAKSDPMVRQVYLRHIAYNPTYRPGTSLWRRF
jgi:type IV secretion system protein VirB3